MIYLLNDLHKHRGLLKNVSPKPGLDSLTRGHSLKQMSSLSTPLYTYTMLKYTTSLYLSSRADSF